MVKYSRTFFSKIQKKKKMFCLSLIIWLSGCFTSMVNSEYHVWTTIYHNNTVSGQQFWPKKKLLSRQSVGGTRQSVGGTKTGEPPRKTKPPDTLASRTWFVSHGQNGVRTHTIYSGENFGHKSHKMETKSRHDHSCGLKR